MLFLTKHAEDRMAERSIPISTVEAVIQHGDAYFIGGAWVWQFMGYRASSWMRPLKSKKLV